MVQGEDHAINGEHVDIQGGDDVIQPVNPVVTPNVRTTTNNAYNHFMSLGGNGPILAEYIWIGGNGDDIRGKTMTLYTVPKDLKDLPEWNFDGSSTNQAPGEDSEVIITPRKIYKDPFRLGKNIIVLCDCSHPITKEPIPSNTRFECAKQMEEAKDAKPWFGIEQEYTLFKDAVTPLGWPKSGFPAPQGPYYCGVGADKAFGRMIADSHYRACLHAGVKICGMNAEVMPGQWEFQVGPCEGIEMGDDLWTARYLMCRVCEMFEIRVSFDPKPMPGDWNGAGCHTNYSTQEMRQVGGYEHIIKAIEKMGKKHEEHIAVYGEGNDRRMTGLHETSKITEFTYGVANRGCSVRIPRKTEAMGCGYFEDRRPASNIDPYLVTGRIVQTTVLD